MREFIHAAGHQETFEAKNAGVPQRLQLLGISRHHAAPESGIHPKFSRRRGQFFAECRRRCRRRDAVQRHFDQRGHAARRRRASRRGKPFPIRAPRLVDVYVCIHHAGHHHKIAGLVHRSASRNFAIASDSRNDARAHVNRRRPLAFRRDHALSADDQVHGCRGIPRSLRRVWHLRSACQNFQKFSE